MGQGANASADVLRHPSLEGAASVLHGQDSRLGLNRVFLSGILADDPQEDKDRNGDPVILLKVAFPAPDTRDTCKGVEAVLDEIEVPKHVADHHRGELRLGKSIFVTGQLSGGGGIIATEVHSGHPPDPGEAGR
jgi:hypothetical protein